METPETEGPEEGLFEERAVMPEAEAVSKKRSKPRQAEYVILRSFVDSIGKRTLNVGGKVKLSSDQAKAWTAAGLVKKVK